MIVPGVSVDAWTTAVQRLRAIAAAALVLAAVAARPDGGPLGTSTIVAIVAIAAALLGTNVSELLAARRGRPRDGALAAYLVLDLLIATVAPWLLGADLRDPATLLVLIPLFEAGVRFRVLGAFAAWFGVSALLAAREILGRGPAPDMATFIEVAVVLLLVGLPASYLAEHLAADLAATARARCATEHRVELLAAVAVAMREMTTLDPDAVVPALGRAATRLGADGIDLARRDDDGAWLTMHMPARPADRPAPPFDPEAIALAWAPGYLGSTRDHDGRVAHHAGLRIGPHEALARAITPVDGAPQAAEAFAVLVAQAQIAFDNAALHKRLRRLSAQHEWRADHDAMTGLANRAALMRALADVFALEPRPPVCLLNLDLDRFKPINDAHGHEAGDAVLCVVADRLRHACGVDALAARFGGDEFVVLVSGEHTRAVAERLIDTLPAALGGPIVLRGGIDVSVGVTVGSAFAASDAATDADDLLRRADQSMYRNKRMRHRAAAMVTT